MIQIDKEQAKHLKGVAISLYTQAAIKALRLKDASTMEILEFISCDEFSAARMAAVEKSLDDLNKVLGISRKKSTPKKEG